MATTKTIELIKIEPKTTTVIIEGISDLVLNRMDNPTRRSLMDERRDKGKSLEKPDKWEQIITSIHWLNEPTEYSEEKMIELLNDPNNAPCITSTGMKKAMGDAVVRNAIDKAKTKFAATVNVLATKGFKIPITFAEHSINEMLMSPQRGKPILARLNTFSGWSAKITFSYLENVYSEDQIVNILNLAGFGIGIGSSRNSGFGRFRVADIL